ncbi:helix-turn-helix domain-containing protein [Myceligenerans crystallogenes]|uniref:Helix-turn-helix domain-containing protein n=1 Tax=Myceligenerans crystallogenes TaxID=316335 RepID=A0ABN2N8G6_9MICO
MTVWTPSATAGAAAACPIAPAVDVVHSRWTTPVLWTLHTSGSMRFGRLQECLGISPKVLTAKLREMERDGLVTRRAYNEVPPRVEYEVTELGLSLQPVFAALGTWWTAHEADVARARDAYAGPLPR